MTVYFINYKEIQFRFYKEKQANKFYKNNYRDYMDSVDEKEIDSEAEKMEFWDNGIHPYDKEVDKQNTIADGFIL